MTFDNKIAAAKDYLAAKGISHVAYAPTLVKLLWRLGLKVPPPHFAGFFGTFLVSGTFFGVLWGAIMWFFWWSSHGTALTYAIGISAGIGLAIGLCVAGYYRYAVRKYSIPSWDEFTPRV